MKPQTYSLPGAVGKTLSLLPAYPGSHLFATALNLTVRDNLPTHARQALEFRTLRIRVLDAGLCFDFQWRDGGFHACRAGGTPDLAIGASAHDFLLLARRQEDPDTLFFSRRLQMEGDTELGLLVKNTLDALELSVFELGRITPKDILTKLKQGLRVSSS